MASKLEFGSMPLKFESGSALEKYFEPAAKDVKVVYEDHVNIVMVARSGRDAYNITFLKNMDGSLRTLSAAKYNLVGRIALGLGIYWMGIDIGQSD
ncbi:MAG: hypothetical protein NT016_01490 [Candidatus Aenigmarchaeota archaeon]|nr:hypothetical protein [Candidatus Aenigmarchaeota archaeon]